MSTTFVAPFEIQPFPKYIRDELERREKDVGMNFISNPDLVLKLKENLPLTPVNMETIYAKGETGYVDYI